VKIILEGNFNDEKQAMSLSEIRERMENNNQTKEGILFIQSGVSEEGLEYLLKSGNTICFSLLFLLEHWNAVQKNKWQSSHYFYYDPLLMPIFPKLRQLLPGKKGVLRVRRTSGEKEKKYHVSDMVFLEELFGPVHDPHFKTGKGDSPVSHLIVSFAVGEGTIAHYERTTAPYLKENVEFEFSFEGGVIYWNSENATPFLDLTVSDSAPWSDQDAVEAPRQERTLGIGFLKTPPPMETWVGQILEHARPLSDKAVASIERFHHLWTKGEKE
jgi:hypothetical protein